MPSSTHSGERQILSLLLECGSELNGAFLTQNLVDKVVLFQSPTKLGEMPSHLQPPLARPLVLEQSLSSVSRQAFGPDICVAATSATRGMG